MRVQMTGGVLAAMLIAGSAQAVPLSFTKLDGVTGGDIANTAVFKADLSAIDGIIASIIIRDSGLPSGSSPGQFSGFDLDAIKISATDCATAACAAAAVGLDVFSFLGSSVVFTPGTQAAPADPKLFGTNAAGTGLDNGVATLGAFDGESSTVTPDGFISLGDNGVIAFNLTSAISGLGYFLYIGEVGDNGEVAASDIQVLPTRVPEPGMLGLLGIGIAGFGLMRRRAA